MRLTDSLIGRSILTDLSLSPEERLAILDTAAMLKRTRKKQISHMWLMGKTLGMIFQHPSTRTRTAFQAGMEQMGGQAIFLGAQDLQMKRGETVGDTAGIISRYVDAIAIRIADPVELMDFARGATKPVFNALTSKDHPLEAMSDVFALREHFGSLEGLTFAYLGDGNNMCHSLMLAMLGSGVNVNVASPQAFGPDPQVVSQAQALAAQTGAKLQNVRHRARGRSWRRSCLYRCTREHGLHRGTRQVDGVGAVSSYTGDHGDGETGGGLYALLAVASRTGS
ncbi:MAG: hypothetical protein M9934_08285 [Thermomicrobiales bacterium]|nr:hypothetical protein [Thermomicrobiales bacterium]